MLMRREDAGVAFSLIDSFLIDSKSCGEIKFIGFHKDFTLNSVLFSHRSYIMQLYGAEHD